jgi:hypothetical protein
MAGYLEDYGVEESRRSKFLGRMIVSLIVAVILVIIGYFVFRTYPAKRQVRAFLADLQKGDYQGAYRSWGCAKPCRDYSFERFLEDWGPKGEFAKGTAEIAKSRYCDTGVIVTLKPAGGREVPLWYQNSDGSLGFSPWPVCAPRIPAPSTPTATPAR